MKKLSKFDLGMIIAFVVIGLLGGASWWYLSGALGDAVQQVSTAKTDFDKNSASQDVTVSQPNTTVLKDDITLLKAQLDPLVENKLNSKGSKLPSLEKKDPVAWKHDLDSEVGRLVAAAKVHGVKLPNNFSFGFTRYQQKNPGDDQTLTLSKQLLAIEQISTILIDAPVKSIQGIRRTYEEEPHAANAPQAPAAPNGTADADRVAGFALTAGSGVYTAYPFEIEFDSSTESLRKIVAGLLQSPYVFVIRSLTIQNLTHESPQMSDLDKLAGVDPSAASVVGSSPGEVAATTSTKGPQFLFGNTLLHVKARIDLIEWNSQAVAATAPTAPSKKTSSPAGN